MISFLQKRLARCGRHIDLRASADRDRRTAAFRRPRPSGIAGCLLLLGTSAAFAHAKLVRATPSAGATIAASPDAVTLEFSEGIVPRLSDVTVRDSAGRPVATGHQGSGAALSVRLSGKLAPGKYTVSWHAVSVDSHRTEGRFIFVVAP